MTYFLLAGNFLMLTGFILRLSRLPPQIPLLYSKPWGEDQLVDLWLIFTMPFILNLFVFLNNFIVKKYFTDNFLIKKIIYYFNLFLIFTLTFAFLRIIFLVT